MKGSCKKKVEGGKLIKIDVNYNKIIEDIKITGDFFLHPEETILDIEKCLKGMSVKEEKESIIKRIEEVVKEKSMELIGISPRIIAEVLTEALL